MKKTTKILHFVYCKLRDDLIIILSIIIGIAKKGQETREDHDTQYTS